ncbi:MAG: phosphoglucosamine mutase [Acidobacteria bacterium]|nr:phosphoglucosamine mutase [Acidobacteriota bacterium]
MSLFGTDGMRAVFGTPPLDRATVQAVGYWFARLSLPAVRPAGSRPLLILGGDTRDSREEISGWLAAAVRAGGADVRSAGIVPTPAVAFLVADLGAAGGIVVSASHNPWTDNGLKLIGADGFKVDPALEREIEDRIAAGAPDRLGGSAGLREESGLAERYLDHLRASLPAGRPLEGLRLAIDAANGAAAPHAARLFVSLGADCHVTGDAPDGRNINRDCGSTCTDRIVALTLETGSDLGASFDGDADRAILCDHEGRVCDGDALLYVWASHLAERDELPGRRIVATTMSNLGLERALERRDIRILRCGVGDREVAEAMRREGVRLGGEQSGHLLDLNLATTGDGLLTAASVAAIVASSGRSLADLAAGFQRFPQVLRNVTVREKLPLKNVPGLSDAVASVERDLGSSGRVLLRYSGTEPLARVMIEGPDQERIEGLCERIARVLEVELGTG